jgi:hypothetical protein
LLQFIDGRIFFNLHVQILLLFIDMNHLFAQK